MYLTVVLKFRCDWQIRRKIKSRKHNKRSDANLANIPQSDTSNIYNVASQKTDHFTIN